MSLLHGLDTIYDIPNSLCNRMRLLSFFIYCAQYGLNFFISFFFLRLELFVRKFSASIPWVSVVSLPYYHSQQPSDTCNKT
jgi:hypothetical protein